jgi:hypothetical protein
LHEDKTNCILKAALDENNKMHNNGQHCWVSCIYYILKELDMLKILKNRVAQASLCDQKLLI